MKTTRQRFRKQGEAGFMSMGAHVHGAIWMAILMVALSILAAQLDWNIWLTFGVGFIPIFVLGHMIGEFTFGIHCRFSARRSPSTNAHRNHSKK
jgi:fatty acid desaturase